MMQNPILIGVTLLDPKVAFFLSTTGELPTFPSWNKSNKLFLIWLVVIYSCKDGGGGVCRRCFHDIGSWGVMFRTTATCPSVLSSLLIVL